MDSEYRIDELAQRAGTTVRNIRAYQDRGILPPPRRQGRIAVYSDAHLARLRLIGNMLGRGYSLANIAELVEAWEGGQNIGDLLGLEAALTEPWSQESPIRVNALELAELFGIGTDEVESAVALLSDALTEGIVRTEGDGFVVDSPRLLRVGAELVAAGVPLEAVLGAAAADSPRSSMRSRRGSWSWSRPTCSTRWGSRSRPRRCPGWPNWSGGCGPWPARRSAPSWPTRCSARSRPA